MKRAIEDDLLRWKNQKKRMPLLLRGARQVGKTYVIEKLGHEHFDIFISINFELNPEYKRCFKSLNSSNIVNAIGLMTNKPIIPGKTLLFFDEIQECSQAIMSLRYFKEQMPDLHVIGAGSLLEFTLNDSNFRMPVGRIQFKYLRPLSFNEYLEAAGYLMLKEYLNSIHIDDTIEEAVHGKLMGLVREYFALGGMPAVVSEYLESKNLLQCQEIQSAILTSYRHDFGKYAGRMPHQHLQTIFAKAPGLIGQWLKYTSLDPETAPSTLKNALKKLCDAGLIILIYSTSGTGLPFVSHMNEKKCKFLFLDIGLVKRACNLELNVLFNEDLLLINSGALAEQFVGQELLSCLNSDEPNSLYFWAREKKNSSAEVDYLIAVGSKIIPVEVKAGAIGTLRSLKLFLKEKKIPLGVRISSLSLSLEDSILTIPFYLIDQLPRLIREVYASF